LVGEIRGRKEIQQQKRRKKKKLANEGSALHTPKEGGAKVIITSSSYINIRDKTGVYTQNHIRNGRKSMMMKMPSIINGGELR
jgi:hypothetical protein